MTESQSPLDTALDVLVYAPVGLALTAAEEIPKLAAKGRERVTQQLTIARVLGQFVVAQGRKELNRRFAPAPASGPASGESASNAGVSPSAGVSPVAGAAGPDGGPDVSYEDLLATSNGETGAGASPRPEAADTLRSEDSAGRHVRAEGLAIPGYDSLAASQVVQRLAGLSSDELAAVGAYEAAHRNRRTILTRVRQLQAS